MIRKRREARERAELKAALEADAAWWTAFDALLLPDFRWLQSKGWEPTRKQIDRKYEQANGDSKHIRRESAWSAYLRKMMDPMSDRPPLPIAGRIVAGAGPTIYGYVQDGDIYWKKL